MRKSKIIEKLHVFVFFDNNKLKVILKLCSNPACQKQLMFIRGDNRMPRNDLLCVECTVKTGRENIRTSKRKIITVG